MTKKMSLDDGEVLPQSVPVSVIFERHPSTSRWQNYYWKVGGVVSGSHAEQGEVSMVRQEDGVSFFLVTGMEITLFRDECESYYHNLKSPRPSVYVVARAPEDGEMDDDAPPDVFAVSLNFDYAHSSLEADDLVYAVPVSPELYRWSEGYILENYVAEKRVKRKRQNWKQSGNFSAQRDGQ